jgi:hypothetical protein
MGEEDQLSPSHIVRLLVDNDKEELNKLFTPENLDKSEHLSELEGSLGYLDYTRAEHDYGRKGVERFYRGFLDLDELLDAEEGSWTREVIDGKPHRRPKLGRYLLEGLSWLALPVKLFSKMYDYTLNKTKKHILAAGVGAFAMYESSMLIFTAGLSYLNYNTYGMSFLNEFLFNLNAVRPIFMIGGIGCALSSMGSLFGMVSIERRKFSTKRVSRDVIEADIVDLTKRFYTVWDRYARILTSEPTSAVTLRELDGMYMLVTTKNSVGKFDDIRELRAYEALITPFVEKAIGKKISPRGTIHFCPKKVGGVTLVVPTVFLGKLVPSYAFGPIFLNRTRISASPEYIFGYAHEWAHASGIASEPMANYYALCAMEDIAERYPLQGYDLFSATSRLCFAVAALTEKIKNREELYKRLSELNVPEFVFDAFEHEFSPEMSPIPPFEELLEGGVEAQFAGLYATSSYVALKLVEKGNIIPRGILVGSKLKANA